LIVEPGDGLVVKDDEGTEVLTQLKIAKMNLEH
jgi:hypothetical protein